MIIWGSTGREFVVSQGEFHCPFCNAQRRCVTKRVARYFTLYFIPLFEIQNLGECLECLACSHQFDPHVRNHRPPIDDGRASALPPAVPRPAAQRPQIASSADWAAPAPPRRPVEEKRIEIVQLPAETKARPVVGTPRLPGADEPSRLRWYVLIGVGAAVVVLGLFFLLRGERQAVRGPGPVPVNGQAPPAAPIPAGPPRDGAPAVLEHPNTVGGVAVTADGRRLLTSGPERTVRLWDLELGSEIARMQGHADMSWSAAIADDGSRGVTATFDGRVHVWDLIARTEERTERLHQGRASKLAVTPDGRMVLSPGADRIVELWNATTGQRVHTLKGHRGPVICAAFLPGGRRGLSGSGDIRKSDLPEPDNSVRLWDLQTGNLIKTMEGHSGPVDNVASSPDGKYAVSGSYDRTVRVWDLATGQEVRRYEGHTEPVKCVAWSRDGRWIFSGGDDWVLVWDSQKVNEVHRVHHEKVECLAVSADARILVSGGMDKNARVWLMPAHVSGKGK